MAVHEIIDKAERELKQALGIVVCIHTDPIATSDPAVNAVRDRIAAYLSALNPPLTLHDFRMVPGQRQVNLVFDCVLPVGFADREGFIKTLTAFVKELDPRYELIVQLDTDFS